MIPYSKKIIAYKIAIHYPLPKAKCMGLQIMR